MRFPSRWMGAAFMAAAMFLTVPVAHAATAGPGCDASRPAVAHHPGGRTATGPRTLIPCATETGHYTGETGIGVTRTGRVWFSAADWEWALMRTDDKGANWQRFHVPGPQAFPGCYVATSALTPCSDSESDKYNTVADSFLYVDRDTSRVFWSKTYGLAVCSSLNFSDNGEDWTPVTRFACPGGDYGKLASGPPPAGGAQPTGYPNVVYECVNAPAPVFVVGPARGCYKSLDGGLTWNLSGLPATPSPLAPGCLQFQEPEVVGRDGTVYLPLNCGSQGVMVAISHDEAQTWSYATVPIGSTGNSAGLLAGVSAAVDDAGTLYVVWPGSDNKVYMASSKDQGVSWHGPFDVTAPGILEGSPHAQIAARQPGHVAIAYYGYPKGGDGQTLDGYLTESFDADSAKPLLYSAMLNRPGDHLYFPVKSGSLPRNDYLGVTIAPDGQPWTALVKLLSDTPDSQGYVQSTGFVGRLVNASR